MKTFSFSEETSNFYVSSKHSKSVDLMINIFAECYSQQSRILQVSRVGLDQSLKYTQNGKSSKHDYIINLLLVIHGSLSPLSFCLLKKTLKEDNCHHKRANNSYFNGVNYGPSRLIFGYCCIIPSS